MGLFFNRKKSGRYAEALILTLLYIGAGFYFNSQDPCWIKSDLPILTILLAIITLFHGLGPGIVSLLTIGLVMKEAYAQFEVETFLSQFVLVLIYGEFHYYWQKVIGAQNYELQYLNRKFDEMVKAFYALKISHDQLEKMYVTKPTSLRSSLEIIRREKKEEALSKFMLLLQKSYAVQRAVLAELEKNVLHPLASAGDVVADYEDPLVQKAIEKKMPVYIAEDPHTESAYIAVIPVMDEEETKWLLAIEEIPFLSYNKDTLTTIAILVQYLYYELQRTEIIERVASRFRLLNEAFVYELHRLTELERRYRVESTLLVFKTRDPLLFHLLKQKVERTLRSLEVMTEYSDEGVHCLAVLFPLVDDSAVEGYVSRIKKILANENLEGLDYATFGLAQRKLYLRYMGIENG
ncbi:PelD GGDEF domain-containing protein [Hydrogenimonas sp. SS33]|uniref:PelD GGDEF domain-containing protein n=1 Tax=Hydrogenimonas leucolamina TaxID=2954236 RepID=UPI00336BDD17